MKGQILRVFIVIFILCLWFISCGKSTVCPYGTQMSGGFCYYLDADSQYVRDAHESDISTGDAQLVDSAVDGQNGLDESAQDAGGEDRFQDGQVVDTHFDQVSDATGQDAVSFDGQQDVLFQDLLFDTSTPDVPSGDDVTPGD